MITRTLLRTALVFAICLLLAAPATARIYWANQGGDSIGRAEGDGSGVDEDFIDGATAPTAVAIDASHIYWTQGGMSGSIGRADLDGTDPDQGFLAVGASPRGLALDATRLYWSHEVASAGKIGSVAPDGSSPNQTFLSAASSPCGVSADADKIYFANGGAPGSLASAHGQFAINQTFITDTNDPCGVAAAGGYIYWANQAGNSIGRASIDGSTPDESFIDANGPCGVAVDGKHVYWTSTGDDSVGRADLDGSAPDGSFITGADDPCGMAVSPTQQATPSSLSFPRTRVGAGSDIQSLFVANTSSSLLDVTDVSLVGRDAGDFDLTGDGCTVNVTPPSSGCVLNVKFRPLAKGKRRARVRIAGNAAGSPERVALAGRGRRP